MLWLRDGSQLIKVACKGCKDGHRIAKCQHRSRDLFPTRASGRPLKEQERLNASSVVPLYRMRPDVSTPRNCDNSDEICAQTAVHEYGKTLLNGCDYCKLCVHPILNFEIVGHHDHSAGPKATKTKVKKIKKRGVAASAAAAPRLETNDTQKSMEQCMSLETSLAACPTCQQHISADNTSVARSTSLPAVAHSLRALPASDVVPSHQIAHRKGVSSSDGTQPAGAGASLPSDSALSVSSLQFRPYQPIAATSASLVAAAMNLEQKYHQAFQAQPTPYESMSSLLMTQEQYAGQHAALQFHEQLAVQRRDAQMDAQLQSAYAELQFYKYPIFSTDPPVSHQPVPLPGSMSFAEDVTGCCGDGVSCSCGNDCACNNCAFHSIRTGIEDRLESDVHAAYFGQDLTSQTRLPVDFELDFESYDDVPISTIDEAPDLDYINDAFPDIVSDNEDDEDVLQEGFSAVLSAPVQPPGPSTRRSVITEHITSIHRPGKQPLASHKSAMGEYDDNTAATPAVPPGSVRGKQKCCSSRVPSMTAKTSQSLVDGDSLPSDGMARVAEHPLCMNVAVESAYFPQEQAARPSEGGLPSWPDIPAASEGFDFAQFLTP